MDHEQLRALAAQLIAGDLSAESFLRTLVPGDAQLPDATLDLDRARRCGYPEVVYGEGKSVDSLRSIFTEMVGHDISVLATRISSDKAEPLLEAFDSASYNATARTFRIPSGPIAQPIGQVAVITAGTSDRPVAEEAAETLDWMGVGHQIVHDVGVAGPHRLPRHLDLLRQCDAVVVVAGMEGALPSVVGGYVDCPVVAVPTSVGYGASLGGITALLGMLNSCAANVAVVNIDAGFKGGFLAGLVARRAGNHR